jgi:hypothetical protein
MGVKLGLWHYRKKHRLKVLEDRMLRKIFEQKRDEIIGSWRKLHKEKLHNLYFSPKIIKMIKLRWEGRRMRSEFW